MSGNAEKGQADISFGHVSPVEVQLRDVSTQFTDVPPPWMKPFKAIGSKGKLSSLQLEPKTVLDSVNASIAAGTLTAILGGSGSGKTTLLNAISHRVSSSKLLTSGAITYNGSTDLRTVRSAYVMQQDVLLPTLTVRETLQYSADLRLPPPTTEAERRAIVEHVILELGLKEAAGTRIGSSAHKGCSGGEKRRTSIGVQMLSSPSLLFCDEPTTGLDAYSAFQVVQRLKKLAESGRTVIMSIHAPRSEIWGLFDNVILLSKGATLYSASALGAADHFKECGFNLPPFVNPAEFLIDLAAVDTRSEDREEKSVARVRRLQQVWKDHQSKSNQEPVLDGLVAPLELLEHPNTSNKRQSVSFRRQVRILSSRTTKVTIRDPLGIAASIFEAVIMSIITGWIFLQLGQDLSAIRSREGALYIGAAIQGYLILIFECYRLTHDIQIFDREHKEGVISVSAFLISRRWARLFLEDIPVPTIFTLIYYFMVGFRLNAPTFFIYYAVVVLTHYLAVLLATICVAVSRDFAAASLIANLSYTLQSIACGFFIQQSQIPVYTRWTKWITFNYYVFGALVYNEFIGVDGGYDGQFYDCPTSKDPHDPACQQYVGRFIVESLGFPTDWLWRPIVVIISFVVLFAILGWLILTFWKVEIDVASARKGNQDILLQLDKIESMATESVTPVVVKLQDFGLEVLNRNLFKQSTTKTILHPVTASFDAGKINVIMGPSGSGKTSLLQSLAQRLEDSAGSKYRPSGQILLNGAVPSTEVLKAVASFVTQEDDALMAELTVRETLRFAAGLRLPNSMSKAEKYRRAENVMLKMGLKDAADNVIGSDLKKGISGGEKRRVSIAIQVLTEPKVLLLDEPTSGLDAFTATSILDVLTTLAFEGRTIIMTIHQARSDVFRVFDNILLLARGGAQVYSGPGSEMLAHFSTLGYVCPRATNPADFVLDLITVDLQEAGREALTREKVSGIIGSWRMVQSTRNRLIRSTSYIATPAELSSLIRRSSPFTTTFPLIVHRSTLQTFRSPDIMLAKTMQVIGIGLIFGLFFAPVQSDYDSVQSRMGFVQEVAALYFVGMLQNLSVYPLARTLFYREHDDRCYGPLTFLASYTLLELPFTAVSSLVFGALTYAIGLKHTAAFAFIGAFECFGVITCGESVGIVFCTLFKSHVGFSVQIMSIFLSLATIMGGILSLDIPAFLAAWNWLSPIKYQVGSMAKYGMAGVVFTCSEAQKVGGICPIRTGEEALELYHLDIDGGAYLWGLAACVIIYRIVAFGVLFTARKRWDWYWLTRAWRRVHAQSLGVSELEVETLRSV